MKCPYCDYIDGWDSEKMESVGGKEGVFWKLPIKMERPEGYMEFTRSVFGCPKCRKIFIDELS